MISAQTLRVCREGKPVPTHRVVARGHAFPDPALAASLNGKSELSGGRGNRFARVGANALDHGAQAVGALRCQVLAKSEFVE